MINFLLNKNLFLIWMHWHFINVPKEIVSAWKNFIIFIFNFFSISFLIKTFFSYWHRYQWSYGKNFDLKIYLNALVSNLISRLFGATIRLIFIILFFLFEIIVFLIGIFVLILWLLIPIITIMTAIAGFNLIYYGYFL